MKLFHHICHILSLLLITGCGLIYDNLDDCPPIDNVTLLFTHMVSGSDLFNNLVQTVDIMVYDENNRLVTHRTIQKADMVKFRAVRPDGKSGTRLNLAPGVYRIVCWGNAGVNTMFQNITTSHTIDEGRLQHATSGTGRGECYDPLFYAPRMVNVNTSEVFIIAVPEQGTLTSSIDFTSAHDTLEVYVKSLNSTFSDTPKKMEVEVSPVPWAYDFQMRPQYGRPFGFIQKTRNLAFENGTVDGAQFLVAQIENENPIQIHVRDPNTHSTICAVNLKEFLMDNQIVLDPTGHDLVRVMIEIIGLDVKVTVPNWNGIGIKPTF